MGNLFVNSFCRAHRSCPGIAENFQVFRFRTRFNGRVTPAMYIYRTRTGCGMVRQRLLRPGYVSDHGRERHIFFSSTTYTDPGGVIVGLSLAPQSCLMTFPQTTERQSR